MMISQKNFHFLRNAQKLSKYLLHTDYTKKGNRLSDCPKHCLLVALPIKVSSFRKGHTQDLSLALLN